MHARVALGLLLALLWSGAGVGCAPRQRVAISAEPRPVAIFLDGKELPLETEALELKSNRDHTLFFKREGYRSQLVVLHSREIEGKKSLVPDRIDLTLREAFDTTPSLELEFDED